ncbi:MAG: hypothetical protein PHC49_10710 [Desulfuromonadaceae bacterium]|nr:hypothetical protein [Desulfuromonadaceae bacterium]
MLMTEKELDFIETIGDLKRAIATVPDDTPLEDGMNCGMYLRYHEAVPREGEPESPAYVEFR